MPRRESRNRASGGELVLTPTQFERVRTILMRYSGVSLDRISQRVMTTGLAQRLQATGLSFEAYVSRVAQISGQGELQQLSELVLNHETVFFRNQPHMRALSDMVIPEIHRRKYPGEPLRIWSAGCSTGEEPYSIAITALEVLSHRLTRPIQVWATDLSEAALHKARTGTYRGRTLSNVSPDVLNRYFEYAGGAWSVSKEVRNLVQFEQLNLLLPFPSHAQGVDVIFCQNVTIYFELETFRDLVDRFYRILPEGGFLFLGFSETLWNIYDKFRLREVEGAFIYVKESQPLPIEISKDMLPSFKVSGSSATPAGRQNPHRSIGRSSDTSAQRLSPDTDAPRPEPQDMEPIIQQGRDLLDAGHVDQVLDLLYKIPLNGPHAPKTMALIAQAHANRGDLDVASAEARRAIELNPLTTEAYILLGVLYARQGQPQDAAQQLERARYLDSDAALISFHLAEVYRQMDRQQAAVREYRNTLQKLATYSSETLLDGVSVSLLRETCERYIHMLK